MNPFLLLAAALLIGGTLVYVLAPVLWPAPDAGGWGGDEAVEALLRQRAEAYRAIRELEVDRQLGRLEEGAYAAARAELEQRAIGALRALDAWEAEADAVLARATGRARRETGDER